MVVEPVRLSPSEELLCLTLLRDANKLLKKWAKFYGFRKGREFRNKVFGGDLNPGNVIPKGKLKQFHADLEIIMSVRNDAVASLGGRTVEMAMLQGYISLSNKHARRWFHAGGGADLEDFEQEAALALLDAIYGFIREDITFSTYAWAVVKNRMIYSSNKLSKLSPFTNDDRELLIRFEDAKMDFDGPVSFDMVVTSLGLEESEITLLNQMLTRVVNESQISEGSERDSSNAMSPRSGNDYTALRRDVRASDGDQSVVLSVRSAIERAALTEFEAAVLETSLTPYYGWQTDIAKKYINPVTGKVYTRAGTGVALKNAKAKVKEQLEEAA
jgi:DNA-directed RNA polymerase specialized sigma subunit